MKRFAPRNLFTLCAAASLLLGVALCAMWVRSRNTCDWLRVEIGTRQTEVKAVYGFVWLATWDASDRIYRRFETGYSSYPADRETVLIRAKLTDTPEHYKFLGFHLYREAGLPTLFALIIPNWFLVLVTLVLPAAWLGKRLRARRRASRGFCATCGYDVRASPARCPECGTTT